jgi:hypothetical protein
MDVEDDELDELAVVAKPPIVPSLVLEPLLWAADNVAAAVAAADAYWLMDELDPMDCIVPLK